MQLEQHPAYIAGYQAFLNNLPFSSNPGYNDDTEESAIWGCGWHDAREVCKVINKYLESKKELMELFVP